MRLLLFLLSSFLAGWVLGRSVLALVEARKNEGQSAKAGWISFCLRLCVAMVLVGVTGFVHRGYLGPTLTGSSQTESSRRGYAGSYYQFQLGHSRIPRANIWEPRLISPSIPTALDYLDRGSSIWNGKYKCVGCHVNGIYLMVRPELTPFVGRPPSDTRRFVLSSLRPYLEGGDEKVLRLGHRAAQVVWASAGLASWDAHVSGTLSPETDKALRLMFRLQLQNGAWKVPDCWPPLQSSSFQIATVAALAAATAPGWISSLGDPDLARRVDLLQKFLRSEAPPHDYDRVWLLWASAHLDGILSGEKRAELIDDIRSRQNEDGGWSLRAFGGPSGWKTENGAVGSEDRRFGSPASDGHMTGLVLIGLREAGVPFSDPGVQRAMLWIDSNQRVSGRWWTESLNSDKYHLITYSGTCLVLLSLSKYRALARPEP